MGTQNRDQNREAQGGVGKRKQPQDPKLNPDRDDDNLIERGSNDEAQGTSKPDANRTGKW